MALLTFPSDKSDFTAPNGITYTWDVADEKWRVKAFRSQDDILVVVGAAPPDDPKKGDLWYDSSPDSLKLFVYDGAAWVAATPLDGVNADIEAINDAIEELQETVADALDVQATLVHKVEALEGTVIDGKWYAESRSNPREGGFDVTTGGLQSMSDWNADFLRIHKTDTTGKVFTFAEVSTGDYIRIGAPGSTAVYKIIGVPSGSLDWQAFEVELANFTGTPIPDLTYDFEFLPSFDPSAYATIQYVDAQDDLDVKLGAVNEVSTGFRIKNDGNTLISTATPGELGLYHVKDPSSGNDGWAANKGYVDTKLGNYVPIDGGPEGFVNMTGSLGFAGGGEDGANLYFENNGFARWGFGPYATGQYGGYVFCRDDTTFEIGTYRDVDLRINATNPEFVHSPSVPDPSEDDHATNRKYVLDQIRANAGSDYILPTATVQELGGIKVAASGGTWVGATRINGSGTLGVVQSSNTTKGVNYKGQACVTGNSTPTASDYQQGALIFSTSTNSLYIRT